MNNLLHIKGLLKAKEGNKPGPVKIPADVSLNSGRIINLMSELRDAYDKWNNLSVEFNPLIRVHYNCVVAKSNRISYVLNANNYKKCKIVGAVYEVKDNSPRHLITYLVDPKTILDTLKLLQNCVDILDKYFEGWIDNEKLQDAVKKWDKRIYGMSKSKFAGIIHDCVYVENIDICEDAKTVNHDVLVTIYDVGFDDLQQFLNNIGCNVTQNNIVGNSVYMNAENYNILIEQYPFLVSMAVIDISKITHENYDISVNQSHIIQDPGNEPTIGVIDTHFNEDVYFSDWVEYQNCMDESIPIEEDDKLHGTCVDSLIVDGPSLNPELDDGCGNFKVRHFGVATGGNFSSFSILKSIDKIIRNNRDIKVWNLSLGAVLEISQNYVSPQAAYLDYLQYIFDDIIFVVAGTNKSPKLNQELIGSPADSINSLVVNSVDFFGNISSYSRKGPVLSFYQKPDICCVGGDDNKKMHLFCSRGDTFSAGTSYSAPWISRKLSYLMQVLNLPREIAKALIIDSAASWKTQTDNYMGYGIVPVNIKDVVNSSDDEIKFYIHENIDSYESYSNDIPIPVVKDSHPYVARATMCYFPSCNRDMGVDYTNSELTLAFGRINNDYKLKPIDNNVQGDEGEYIYESQARSFFRKWDNVKHIKEKFSTSSRSRKAYSPKMWGLRIRFSKRNKKIFTKPLKFGLVVTLKEIKGINRINEFIQNCSIRGWIVNEVNIENMVTIYSSSNVDIELNE